MITKYVFFALSQNDQAKVKQIIDIEPSEYGLTLRSTIPISVFQKFTDSSIDLLLSNTLYISGFKATYMK